MEGEPAYYYKDRFFNSNGDFKQLAVDEDAASIGGVHHIDCVNDEVWLLQCPKGTDISSLESSKIKLPGRTNWQELEMVAVEYAEPANTAFGYSTRKGRYGVRLIPIKGNIVLRKKLPSYSVISAEKVREPKERIPVPDCVRVVRHPLLGRDFEKSKISDSIRKRLKQADMKSFVMSHELHQNMILERSPCRPKRKAKIERKLVESHTAEQCKIPVKRIKTESYKIQEDVTDDLRWINEL